MPTVTELPVAPSLSRSAVAARPSDTGSPSRLRAWKHRLSVSASVPFSRTLGPRIDRAFGILMYHRVTPVPAGVDAPTWNVPPDRFRAQLAGLLNRGYQAWPLRQVLEHHRQHREVPRKVFVVTFDDGFENVYRSAFPVLQELNVPATVFLATAFLDAETPFVSDDWNSAGSPEVPAVSWKPLTTSQCREMQASGLIDLATHTHAHADYRDRPDVLEADLRKSLAFPYGTKKCGFAGPVLAEAARRAGVLCSLTTEAELILPGRDPFDWGRFTAEPWDTAATLAAKLDGWYSFGRELWWKVRRN